MNLVEIIEKASECQYHMIGGRVSEIEICKFWSVTQELANKYGGVSFVGRLFPLELGRIGNIDSPYTLVTCKHFVLPTYEVTRIDIKKVDDFPRNRSGIMLRFPVTTSLEYEHSLLALEALPGRLSVEFVDVNAKRVMEVWLPL